MASRATSADSLHCRGILEGREIAEIRLTEIRAANHAAENLGVAGLWEIADEPHGLRAQRPAQLIRDGIPNLAPQRVGRVVTWTQHHEYDDRLALELVRHADRRRLEHRGMRGRRGFDFRGPYPLARHLERVVAAALDVPKAVAVYARPVAVHPDVRKPGPVRGQVLLRVAPESARHPRPRLADDELAHRAAQRMAVRVRHVGCDPGDRTGKRRGFERRPRGAAEDATRALRAARVIDERRSLVADDAEVPPPRLRIPRLARRAKDEERRPIVSAH